MIYVRMTRTTNLDGDANPDISIYNTLASNTYSTVHNNGQSGLLVWLGVLVNGNAKEMRIGDEGKSQTSKAYIMLNKETMRIEESLNVTFDESLPEPKSSPLVEDDRINELVVQDQWVTVITS
ncbi:hypothetical protein Tco_0612228 [Tanacetum coccineum]